MSLTVIVSCLGLSLLLGAAMLLAFVGLLALHEAPYSGDVAETQRLGRLALLAGTVFLVLVMLVLVFGKLSGATG